MSILIGPTRNLSKFRISRRCRMPTLEDQRVLAALPKDVPEKTWAEIFLKEDTDMMIFEIREDIIEEALKVIYERYMEKQTSLFTAYCTAEAWLKLIDWHFYRHDPGEDPTAYPPCYIPKRLESWIPDEMPDPSPKDTWGRQTLTLSEDCSEEGLQKWPSSSSIDVPVVEEIPRECWFPGKVAFPTSEQVEDEEIDYSYEDDTSAMVSRASEDNMMADSEVLQKVTDYSTDELSGKVSAPKMTTPVDASLQGAGDSAMRTTVKQKRIKSKSFSNKSVSGRSRMQLPPLDGDSRSRVSVISDCRLRNLRLETQYEISSEKIESLQGDTTKKK